MEKIEKKRMENIKNVFSILSEIERYEPLECSCELEEEIYTLAIYLKGIIGDFIEEE